ncbi:hypothetical protein PG989_012908 [Apiospora arundinis]
MSDNMYDINIDALLGIDTHPLTHVTQPGTAQVDATDETLEGDGLLAAWDFGDPQQIHPDPSQVPGSAHTEGFDWYGTAHEAQFGWNTDTGTYGAQATLDQFSAPGTQYEGFAFDYTAVGANDMTLFDNTNTFTTGTNPGVFHYESDLPVSSVGPAFSANNNSNTLGTSTSPLIGQGQSFDESALLLPHAGFDATADQ